MERILCGLDSWENQVFRPVTPGREAARVVLKMDVSAAGHVLTALAIGLLLGFERERSHAASGGPSKAAGVRTFALVSLVGVLAAMFGPVVVGAGFLAVGAALVVGYARTSTADPGLTTEASALATYLLGVLAWQQTQLAVAIAVVVTVVLMAKAWLHHFTRDVVTEVEARDALKFFVVAFVILPLLPNRSIGPYGVINLRHIWFLVVAVIGIGWVGYIAVRILGVRRGLLVTGFAGGFISASATTGAMGREARLHGTDVRAALAAALAASISTVIQLGIVTGVANVGLLEAVWPAYVAGAVATGIEIVALAVVMGRHPSSEPESPAMGQGRPFSFWPAVVLAVVITAVLLGARWGGSVFGPAGTVAASGLAGFADVHGPVLAVATLDAGRSITAGTAFLAIAAAIVANTATKCVLAFLGGGVRFGLRFTALILFPAAAILGTLALLAGSA